MAAPNGPVILDSYLGLITSEHNQKPKFVATVALSCQPMVDQANAALSMPALFDVDVAVGDQLDTIGEWVGISRTIAVPLTNVYFSLDIEGLGLDQGYLLGPFDPLEGLVSLNDATYRFLIKAKIIANSWDGTVAGAVVALQELFDNVSPGSNIFIQDNCDLSMFFAISGVVPPPVYMALLSQGLLNLKPAGIEAFYFVTSVPSAPIFGLDVENQYVSGLDVGALEIDMPT